MANVRALKPSVAEGISEESSASPLSPVSPTSPDSPLAPHTSQLTSEPVNSSYNLDRESIYSFDSVSTNGRLLDRLGFDNDETYDEEYELAKRESLISVQSTGRLLDRLDLEDRPGNRQFPQKFKPISVSNSISKDRLPPVSSPGTLHNNLAAIRGLSKNGSHSSVSSNSPRETHVSLKHVPMKVVFQTTNNSVDSFKSDMASINKIRTGSSASLSTLTRPLQHTSSSSSSNSSSPSLTHLTIQRRSSDTLQASGPMPDSPDTLNQFDVEFKDSLDRTSDSPIDTQITQSQLPMRGVMRTPSAPIIRGNNEFIEGRRAISEGSSISITSVNGISRTPSATSSTQHSESSQNSDLSPESRTRLAQQFRAMGKHREASYQLQIAANAPFNYPPAMLLYAMALRFGHGVKQNDKQSIKWLCRCILVHSTHSNLVNVSQVMEKLNLLQPEDLVKLIIRNLDNTNDKDPQMNGTDAIKLFNIFSTFSKAQISRIASISKSQADVVAVSYHELGKTLYHGWGLENRDEINGIKCISKAGSLGYVNSMVELGEIWCSKSKYHKKDPHKAAAWLRLGEIFGVKSMGNSWIYKDKYMITKS